MISKHTHKLKRHKYKSGNYVYFCTLPDCNYKVDVPLALGKRTICNLCNSEFIINEYTIKLALPHCESCSKVRITNLDGKHQYVHKSRIRLMENIANENVEDLRSRLESITVSAEDDI